MAVAVVKVAQTGLRAGEPGDLAEVERLAPGVATYEYARYADALSPEAAARHAADRALGLTAVAKGVAALGAEFDLVLVEGTGSLLERFGPDGWTIAELAWSVQAPVLLVTDSGRDAPSHIALAVELLTIRGIRFAGLVIGSWPRNPDRVARSNVADFECVTGRPLAGVLPVGAPAASRSHDARCTSEDDVFLALAHAGLDAAWGGGFDAAAFRDRADPTPAGTSITG